MPHIRSRAFGPNLSVASLCMSACIAAALLAVDASAAHAGKIKMVSSFPTAATTCNVYPPLTALRMHWRIFPSV